MKNLRYLALAACLLSALPAVAAPAPAQNSPLGQSDKPIEVTAEGSLEWHEAEQMYAAKGNARVTRGDFTIEADQLFAYQTKNDAGQSDITRMVAEGNVHIIAGQHQGWGDKGVYDGNAHLATLTGNNLRFTSKDTTVTATDRMEYWDLRQTAIARGNAIAIQSNRRVEADVLTAQFRDLPNGDQELQSLTADGRVTVVTQSDVARGRRAVYDVSRNIAVMTGGVQVTRGQSQLEGPVAEVDFASGLSRIMNDGSGSGPNGGRVRALLVPAKKN